MLHWKLPSLYLSLAREQGKQLQYENVLASSFNPITQKPLQERKVI